MTNPMEEKKVIELFKIRKKRQIILSVFLIAGMVYIFAVSEKPDLSIPGIPAVYMIYGIIALFVFAIIFSFKNWRCPSCNKYLGKGINPKFCQKCGAKLQ